MVKYGKDFKKQALLLSDELGVKKAAGNQLLHDWQSGGRQKQRANRIGQNAVERA